MKIYPFQPVDNDAIFSRAIDISRFPLMLLIVVIHSNITGLFDPGAVPQTALFTIDLLSNMVARVAVPTFFFISGFLFFYKKDVRQPHFYRSQMQKRVYSLLIPYLLWNLIAFLMLCVKVQPAMASYFPSLAGTHIGWADFINAFGPFTLKPLHGILGTYDPSSAPLDIPMWFIRDLLAIMCLAPLIHWLLSKKRGIFTCSLLVILFICGLWPDACFWFDLTGVCFFCFGSYFAIQGLNPVKIFGGRNLWASTSVLLLIYFIFLVLRALNTCQALDNYIFAAGILVGTPTFLLVCSLLATRGFRVILFLQQGTFFMFAFHYLIASIVKRLTVMVVSPDSSLAFVMTDFVVIGLLVAFSLGVFAVLNTLLPRVCGWLSGARSSRK